MNMIIIHINLKNNKIRINNMKSIKANHKIRLRIKEAKD